MAFFPLSALGGFGAVGNPYQLPAPRLPSGFGGPWGGAVQGALQQAMGAGGAPMWGASGVMGRTVDAPGNDPAGAWHEIGMGRAVDAPGNDPAPDAVGGGAPMWGPSGVMGRTVDAPGNDPAGAWRQIGMGRTVDAPGNDPAPDAPFPPMAGPWGGAWLRAVQGAMPPSMFGQGQMPLSVFGRGGFANLGGFAQLLQQLQAGKYGGPMPGQGDPNRMVPNGWGGLIPAWQAEQNRRNGLVS